MDPISMLLFNALVRRQGINLPQIGSLKVISRPPFLEKKSRIAPPSTEVIFAEVEYPELLQIVPMIARSNNCDEQQAQDTYERWRQGVTMEDGTIILDTVGKIEGKVFYPTEELHRILNPISEAPRIAHQMDLRQTAVWIIGAVLIGGALSWGAITLLNRTGCPFNTQESTAEFPVAVPSDSTASKGTLADSVKAPIQEPSAPEASATTPPAPVPAPSANSASVIAPGQVGYYVVVGTYSTQENADKFIAQAKRKSPSLSFFKLPLRNGKLMVYTAAATSEAKAQQAQRACATFFEDAWIYKHTAR